MDVGAYMIEWLILTAYDLDKDYFMMLILYSYLYFLRSFFFLGVSFLHTLLAKTNAF